jgi:trans-feruloyl-CoA hydratase/vanillin synthase
MDLEKFFFEPLMESPEKFKKLADIAGRWFNRLIEAPQIVVCSINGYCFGGGVDLVGISDLAVAAEDAVMGLSEVNFGVLPAGGTTWAVKNNFNRKQGLRYCLTGETFTGKEAVELGLVNIAVPKEKLAEETERLVGLLVTKNALTLEAIKKVFTKLPTNWYEAVEFENGKAQELAFFQGEKNWLRHGLKKFKDREYKPGLGSYKLDKGE